MTPSSDPTPEISVVIPTYNRLYRSFLRHFAGWCAGALRADGDTRFFHETRLWYFTSFLWTRFKIDVLRQLRPWSFRRALAGRTGA